VTLSRGRHSEMQNSECRLQNSAICILRSAFPTGTQPARTRRSSNRRSSGFNIPARSPSARSASASRRLVCASRASRPSAGDEIACYSIAKEQTKSNGERRRVFKCRTKRKIALPRSSDQFWIDSQRAADSHSPRWLPAV